MTLVEALAELSAGVQRLLEAEEPPRRDGFLQAVDPDLLLVDEPVAEVDAGHRERMLSLFDRGRHRSPRRRTSISSRVSPTGSSSSLRLEISSPTDQ
ncbi:MAG: hypothetical protein ACOCPX_03255 [Halapricum sp.]